MPGAIPGWRDTRMARCTEVRIPTVPIKDPDNIATPAGLEPATNRLTICCTANCATGQCFRSPCGIVIYNFTYEI